MKTGETMENLTLLHQVMKETTPDPKEGHTVVVFETRSGSGEVFRFEIVPGGPAPKKSLLQKIGIGTPPNYWAYAVSAAPSITTQFTTDITMDDSVNKFTLSIDLTYSVNEPKLLVTRRNDDPLKLLRDRAVALIHRAIVGHSWDDIVEHFRRVEQDVVDDILKSLRQFGATCGLRVLDVGLSPRFPAESNVRNITAKGLEILDGEATIQRRRDAYRRVTEVADATAAAVTQMLKSGTSGIQNPTELLQGITSLTAAVGQMRGVTSMSGDGGPAALPGPSAVPLLTAGRQSGLGPVLVELMSQTEPMRCGAAEKNALRAALLHLVAELLTADDAQQEPVKTARERVLTASAEVNLTVDEADSIKTFTQTTALRQRLQ
jgi:hypothetical protein